jgi:hypothetical protein
MQNHRNNTERPDPDGRIKESSATLAWAIFLKIGRKRKWAHFADQIKRYTNWTNKATAKQLSSGNNQTIWRQTILNV